jgi:membrane protein implicated in regulation of membrane protease activity
MPSLNLDTLNCVYLSLFFIGVGYALFVAITGGISGGDGAEIDLPGGDIDVGDIDVPAGGLDAPDVTVSPLSPITVATFVTTFGGLGVLSLQLLGVSAPVSLLIAVAGGLLLAGLMYAFTSQFLVRSQASSEMRRGELVGYQGEVTVPIGEETPGQVRYVTKSGRMSSTARSADGKPIARGQLVTIVSVVGNQVLVRPIATRPEQQE